ncbi:MAG: hypothetical protein KDC98_17950 [Planctomycetes bacterium]|nr:hypothetical protein [Planctomycetota bacterium]
MVAPRLLRAMVLGFATAVVLPSQASYATIATAPATDAALVWDPGRGILFAIESDRLWSRDGSDWVLWADAATPALLAAWYDPARGALTGLDRNSEHAFDGARWSRRLASWPSSGPIGHSAYDSYRRRLVLQVAADLDEWDGVQWHHHVIAAGPGQRDGPFAYDPLHRRTVLYGGNGMTDLWSWNGSVWSLLQLQGAPGARDYATLAFEPSTGRMILYGGDSAPHTTWALNGTTWTPIATTRNPGPREGSKLAWDGVGLLLRGGDHGRGNELWRFAGNDWHRLTGETPVPRDDPLLAWDPVRNEAVMFGGLRREAPLVATLVGDTWTFDGRWQRGQPTVSPSPRMSAGGAWSAANAAVLLFGGDPAVNDTWLWNGTDWTQASPTASPSPRAGFAIAEDPLGGVVLFGGEASPSLPPLGDHWRWNGNDWQQLAPALAPAPRAWTLAARDPVRNRVMLTGGYLTPSTPLQETWEWDGAQWSQHMASPFSWHFQQVRRICFRPDTARIRVEGRDAWEWDGAAWTTLGAIGQTRDGMRIVGDPVRNRVLRYPQAFIVNATASDLEVLTDTAIAVQHYGTACALGNAPGITARGRPSPGNGTFALVTASFAPSAIVMLAVGFNQRNVALGGGCSLLVDAVAAVEWRLADGLGDAAVALPIPAASGLRGVELFAQAAAIDPARALWSVLTLSDGLRLVIGD